MFDCNGDCLPGVPNQEDTVDANGNVVATAGQVRGAVGPPLSTYDDCGFCMRVDDPARDTSCLDCVGVLNGHSKLDSCGTYSNQY